MTSKRVYHPDPLIKPSLQCPYDPSHSLYEERFQRHLEKCEKSHPEIAAKMDRCPYHQTHVILKTEMHLHVLECPYKYLANEAVAEQATLRDIAVPLGPIAVTTENWDNEVNETKYDTMKRNTQLQIAPVPNGMKPAERKKYKNENRVAYGAVTGNMSEGGEIPKDTTIPSLPSQPSRGHERGKPASAVPSVSKPESQKTREPVKNMAVREVPKPMSKKIAASFSGPAQSAGAPQPRTIGRGFIDDTDEFPPLCPVIGGGRGRPAVVAAAARGCPPPGFEGYNPPADERMSARRL